MTPVISVASAFSAFPSFEVFSVEDSAIQVVWHSLPAPHVSLEIGDQVRQVVAPPPAVLRRRG
ncbi:MAG: hypothetical protein QOE07_1306, partial [Acidimicrobiaceae bacterium]|nr:hypothetical protein [Acidimicrobiaceae bacterium]